MWKKEENKGCGHHDEAQRKKQKELKASLVARY
jgi:hypothetical protein